MTVDHQTDREPSPLARGSALRWENHANGRYYAAAVGRNLWGQWEVWRAWGALGTRRGGQRFDPVDDEQAAMRALAAVACTRVRHGYKLRRP